MTAPRFLQWTAKALLVAGLLVALFVLFFDWNWLRGPIERMVTKKTGRALVMHGDLKVKLGWPLPHVEAATVTFANPGWAQEQQMVATDAVAFTVDLLQLLRGRLVFPEVHLQHAVVFLDQGADGRKSWLLDLNQQDEGARVQIGRLTLAQGVIGYDDVANKTSIRSELSTVNTPAGAEGGPGVVFSAQGQYLGIPLKAVGTGGPVLALRDERSPYALKVDATLGQTGVKVDGTVTSLIKFSALDMRLALRGSSLDQLYPLLGIALPVTGAYSTEGRLIHSGHSWRFEKFSGRIGQSDIAGSLQIDTGGPRTALKAELASRVLDLADLGALIGARPGKVQAAIKAAPVPTLVVAPVPKAARVLPDLPFHTERWNSVDAEVDLRAARIRRAAELPLEDLVTHLSLKDAVLTLNPLKFGLAGGQLDGAITLDGRIDPIDARARVQVKKVHMAQLFPTMTLGQANIGLINGEFDLTGKGPSVGVMLAQANGRVILFVDAGTVSKLMMEKASLHLWEILGLNLMGDRQIKLRCAVADFDVRSGTLHAKTLLFDTEVSTIMGVGSIDLEREQLDLTFNPKTKNTSPMALRSPIYLRGSFARPYVGVDKTRVAVRALGALALGLVNPLLTLIPLVDAGPGADSDCAQLVRQARAVPHPARASK